MKKLLLTATLAMSVSSMAIIDHNLGVHTNLATDGIQLGVDYYSEMLNRFGDYHFKTGSVVSLGFNAARSNPSPYVLVGTRMFFEHNAFVLGLRFMGADNADGVRLESVFSYQRKIVKNGDYWVDFSARVSPEEKQYKTVCVGSECTYSEKVFVEQKENYSIGIKTMLFDYK